MQKTPIIILIFILLLITLVWYFDTNKIVDVVEVQNTQEESVQEELNTNEETSLPAEDSTVEETTSANDVVEEKAIQSGVYAPYSADKLSLAEEGDVVLFFKADWCPSCRALDANIVANKTSIPDNVAILTVNYDTQTALKQKYGVTTQHTLVQVDADGNLIKKWSGSPRLESVLAEL